MAVIGKALINGVIYDGGWWRMPDGAVQFTGYDRGEKPVDDALAERERIIELLTTMIGWYSALPSSDPNGAVSSALTEVIDRINKGENK